jgi:hypothetical protein
MKSWNKSFMKGEIFMSNVKPETKEKAKKRMPGWLIAVIVVVVIFAAGAICCNVIS